jgi:hypothetical protein
MSTDSHRTRRRAKGLPTWRIVCYADDFVILVNGTHEDAQALRGQVTGVLAGLGLELSADKTRVAHMSEGFDWIASDRSLQVRRSHLGSSQRRSACATPASRRPAAGRRARGARVGRPEWPPRHSPRSRSPCAIVSTSSSNSPPYSPAASTVNPGSPNILAAVSGRALASSTTCGLPRSARLGRGREPPGLTPQAGPRVAAGSSTPHVGEPATYILFR